MEPERVYTITHTSQWLHILLLLLLLSPLDVAFRKTSCQLGKPIHVPPLSHNYKLDVEDFLFPSHSTLLA